MVRIITDCDEATREIEFIVQRVYQSWGDLDPHEARTIYADVISRIERLKATVMADEQAVREQGDGHNVPDTLDAIDRARIGLTRLEVMLEDRLGEASRWVS
jgi:hypothetical protein